MEEQLRFTRTELSEIADLDTAKRGSPMEGMYYIGFDVPKRTISYCVKDVTGKIFCEGKMPATRLDVDRWLKALPQP